MPHLGVVYKNTRTILSEQLNREARMGVNRERLAGQALPMQTCQTSSCPCSVFTCCLSLATYNFLGEYIEDIPQSKTILVAFRMQ